MFDVHITNIPSRIILDRLLNHLLFVKNRSLRACFMQQPRSRGHGRYFVDINFLRIGKTDQRPRVADTTQVSVEDDILAGVSVKTKPDALTESRTVMPADTSLLGAALVPNKLAK